VGVRRAERTNVDTAGVPTRVTTASPGRGGARSFVAAHVILEFLEVLLVGGVEDATVGITCSFVNGVKW